MSLLAPVVLLSAICFAGAKKVCGVFPLQGTLECGAKNVNAARLAMFCADLESRPEHICDNVRDEIRSRREMLLKHAELATGCTLDIGDVEMQNVWFDTSRHAKKVAERVADTLSVTRFTPIGEELTASGSPQADPEALEQWFMVPESSHSLRTGATPGEHPSPVEAAMAAAAASHDLKPCEK